MHIALFGGVFNPPHRGHLMIAQQVLDFTNTDQVWFLPNWGQHPPKPDVAAVADRLAMTKLLALPRTQVSSLEVDHRLDGNTINLLPHLPAGNDYTFLIGADWLPRFTQWGRWEELVTKLPFLVFPRNGYPNEPLYQNMKLVQNELLITSDISATKIRGRVKQGLSIDQFVPAAVAAYIRDHRLYR